MNRSVQYPGPSQAQETSTGSGGRREKRREEVRTRILKAALDLFTQQGYAVTSVDQIADRADLARRTVFNHFPRKRDMLAVWADDRRALLSGLLAEEKVKRAPARRQLELQMKALARANEEAPALARVLSMGWLSEMGTLETPFPVFDSFTQSVRVGQQRGEFRSSPAPEVVAEVISAVYTDTLDRWLQRANDTKTWSLRSMLLRKLAVILDGVTANA